MSVLIAKNVTKRFGGLEALGHIDLDLKEQSIHSIIGPNGAGKTTFFNCVTGFYTPEEGKILLNGDLNITGLSPDRVTHLGISRTYQNIRLFKNMTAVENMAAAQRDSLVWVPFNELTEDERAELWVSHWPRQSEVPMELGSECTIEEHWDRQRHIEEANNNALAGEALYRSNRRHEEKHWQQCWKEAGGPRYFWMAWAANDIEELRRREIEAYEEGMESLRESLQEIGCR